METDTTLPPEVTDAIDYMDRCGVARAAQGGWSIIRAHLHRLAEENARLRGELEEVHGTLRVVMPLHEQAMAERDALKARIAEAVTGIYQNGLTDHGVVYTQKLTNPRLIGKRVALLPLDDEEPKQ